MKTKKSLSADLEHRRPFFLLIALVFVLSVVLLAFEWKQPVKPVYVFGKLTMEAPEEIIIPSTVQESRPLPPPPRTVALFELVENDFIIEEEPEIFDSDIQSFHPGDLFQPTAEGFKKEEAEEIFIQVEQMPEFPGGMHALMSYINRSVRYPALAQENGIHGKVYVQFVVNADGSVSGAKILRGVHASLDQEALRVVNSLPRWKPGKQGGIPVRVSFQLPVNFVLQ